LSEFTQISRLQKCPYEKDDIYKVVMAVTCFGMMAGDAIAQERGGLKPKQINTLKSQSQGSESSGRPSAKSPTQLLLESLKSTQRPLSSGRPSAKSPTQLLLESAVENAGQQAGQIEGEFRQSATQVDAQGELTTGLVTLMTALDSDGNGEISRLEIRGAVAALNKLDRNKDGKLTPYRGGQRPSPSRPSNIGE
jgi:hypothetical protein